MPVFNWDAGSGPVVKDAFKYYWAIVIPLTFLVFVAWAMAMLLPWRVWLLKNRTDSNQAGSGIGLLHINP
jgi:hypothetical protein